MMGPTMRQVKPEPKLYGEFAEKKLNVLDIPANAGRGWISRYKMSEVRG